jgi:D-3-phosphoglycerate dehydrogenase
MKPKVLVTTVPFAERERLPLVLLENEGVEYLVNPLNKKLTVAELQGLIGDYEIVIAGTEPITEKVLASAKNLKMISRVGIGLDSVDLKAARDRGIIVSYTPDAPAPAVAELTIGLIMGLIRHVQVANAQLHRGQWRRIFGKRIAECTVGVIGVGRIGHRVCEHLLALGCRKILYNDIRAGVWQGDPHGILPAEKDEIYAAADIITVHVPLTMQTRKSIAAPEIGKMKPDVLLVNTARGGIIDEDALYDALRTGRIAGAAIDVFEMEPYAGRLAEFENCILTAHMGSMTIDCRTAMEIEATEEAIRFIRGQALLRQVPEEEYVIQGCGKIE